MKRFITEKLLAWKQNPHRKPLILQGTRQVGKTYLLQHFGKKHFAHVHYFNFENETELKELFTSDLTPKKILDALSLRIQKPIQVETDLVIFDEIQAAPRALTSLKYFQEELPSLALCAAGSLLGIHLSDGSYPVGKVDLLTLYPMSFQEFLMANGDEQYLKFFELNVSEIPSTAHSYLWNQLLRYFVVGGLPEVVKTYIAQKEDLYKALQLTRSKQEELIVGYYSDIAKHSGKTNAMHITRVWKAIPAQLAQSHDGSAHKFKFKGVIPGISRFDRLAGAIDWLEAVGLVIKIPITQSGHLPFFSLYQGKYI